MMTESTCRARIAALRVRKLEQTLAKRARYGVMDGDDLGSVLPPEDFTWHPTANHPDGSFYGYRGWGENMRALCAVLPTYVDPHDALAGRWMTQLWGMQPHCPPPEYAYPELHAEQERYGLVPGIFGPQHFAPDFRIGLELGWGGLLEKIHHYRALNGPDCADFYAAEEHLVLGAQDWIRRTLQTIQAAEAAETDPELRENLHEMAVVNAWVIDHPPRTLREACQWIGWYNLTSRSFNGDGAGGQLDELLRPYYERDVAAGLINDETAIYYIACLLLNETQYYQLGGPDAEGRDKTSHVSYLIIEAAHRLAIPCNLTIRVHDGMDQQFYLTAVKHLFTDRQGWPRFSGDKGLTAGFMRNGYSAALARERIAVGCHWMSIPGREYTLNDVVKINAAKVFEVALWEMLGDDTAVPSVAALWEGFSMHLRRAVLCIAKGFDHHFKYQKNVNPELMISLLCHGPLEQGRDATDGTLEFYNMCVDGSGLATVADSFAALEQRIEREGRLSWIEVAEHLRNNYAGTAGERVRLMLRTSERYGAGESLGDAWALRISELLTALVKEGPTPDGYNMIPGWFSWSNTIKMGKILGATPNGRRAGEPISHGANPDPGFRKDGAPTAMSAAIAAIQPGYGNTAPMQLELDPGIARGEEGLRNVASLISTHFEQGGTLFNINIIDKEKVLAAHADPTQYPDLVVRVTGFTAFFSVLSPEFRQLVVDRMIAE